MNWKFAKHTRRLNIYGSDSVRDIKAAKKLIAEGKIPTDLDAIVYQKSEHSAVGMIIRGRYLEELLKPEADIPTITPNTKPGLKQILKQINQANTRQATYAGLLLYATNTKRFLVFQAKNRNNLVQLLGDNPKPDETPPETVCRIALADGDFEIAPNCLITLTPVEIDGTTFYNYLILTEREFRPAVSERIVNFHWKSFEAMEELTLHPNVVALFERDPKLSRLIRPIEVDFDSLIDEILHSN